MADAPVSTSDLESSKHERELRWETIGERMGWGVIALVLLAALAGLLGPGPLSYRDRTAADGSLSAQYSVVERYEAPAELRLRIDKRLVQNDTVRIAISRSLVDEITPESVSPLPTGVETIGDRSVYSFKMKDLEQYEGEIVAKFLNDDFGVYHYQIGLEGHDPLTITQYVLP